MRRCSCPCNLFIIIIFFNFVILFFYWVTESSGWVFISDNTSHSNNHVNHYLQQIHEHYDAYYVQNDFGHIAVLTVWADNCSEQFKSRYQLGWSVLYVNKTTLQVIHLFFFCPQHGKGPPDGLGGNCKNAVRAEEKFRRHLPAAIDVFLWLQSNFTAVHSPGIGLFSIRKRIFRFVPTGLVPRHHIIESTEFNGISNQYAFGVVKGAPIGRVFHRFTPCACEFCMVGSFVHCLNVDFQGAWSERFLTVTENVQPTIKEQIEADIEHLLDSYRRSELSPFFVMYVKKGCDSPMIAMLTSQSVWNNRSVKAYLLQHNQPVPKGQFNDTAVRVPKSSGLCATRGCNCLKQHMEKLDKHLILNILVEEKKEGRDTVLRSVFAKDEQFKDQRDYSVFHLPKSQMKFLIDFNSRRIDTVGDLRMYV